ncbi:DUF1995 family protein [Synechococcus sp. CBW1006]|uniref:DUF1995 family protein n=1 Tax=Synechococcus sp. CBW1006 TaxID=1353138 RepID=UPI0018CEB1D2|nr:DUF1995 family protein [Synechococcus sp. CBW1006]QPN66364.1 DUF1995 family protein [Synechococcus sp. CBW1006]
MLPADLRAAESQALEALKAALLADAKGRWTVEWRFEGLRVLPVVLRLAAALQEAGQELRLLFSDAGATALAKRDAPDLAGCIASFSDQIRSQSEAPGNELLLLVGASQADYELVEQVCGGHRGAVVLVNGSLEDAAVGIGSVARERRRGFLAGWQSAYALLPQAEATLRRAYPDPWELYRLDPDGYRLCTTFEQKPDAEQQALALAGEEGLDLGGQMRVLDQFIEGLRN